MAANGTQVAVALWGWGQKRKPHNVRSACTKYGQVCISNDVLESVQK